MATRSKTAIVLILLLVVTFFAIPHLIDDFLFDIPEEFGLSVPFAQLLSGVFAVVLLGACILVTLERRTGYLLSTSVGALLFLAVLLRHVPRMIEPGPYWSGWFSETLIVGVGISGLALFIASVLWLKVASSEGA
jgi:hypothetical protein